MEPNHIALWKCTRCYRQQHYLDLLNATHGNVFSFHQLRRLSDRAIDWFSFSLPPLRSSRFKRLLSLSGLFMLTTRLHCSFKVGWRVCYFQDVFLTSHRGWQVDHVDVTVGALTRVCQATKSPWRWAHARLGHRARAAMHLQGWAGHTSNQCSCRMIIRNQPAVPGHDRRTHYMLYGSRKANAKGMKMTYRNTIRLYCTCIL